MKNLYALVTPEAAYDVAEFIARKIPTDCPLPNVQGWKDVSDALYALANDTDFIVTDSEIVPAANDPTADLLSALKLAEEFMAGFEDDETQDGINERLATIRHAIQAA